MSHFKILYRQFLFRLMDVEFLAASARGDSSQLFGQFAALLILLSLGSCYVALIFGSTPRSTPVVWLAQRLLIEITMLVVGVFALLNWESTFPDRRDVQILAPLPIRGRIVFLAKITAAASSLGLTIVALNCFSAFVWPSALAPHGSGLVTHLRFMAAYWITLPAAGAFLYCSILGLQGIIAQLPRGWFLRLSSFVQIAALALFIGVISLQPSFLTAKALGAPENQRALAWLPAYWFMGLFSAISGGYPNTVMEPLAKRALAGLAISILIAAGAFVLSWRRTMKKIAEEPDILSGSRGGVWLPRFGTLPQSALVQFTIRTLCRSRQHRMNLAFYVGVGFAMIAVSRAVLASSLLMICLTAVGTRIAFSRPLDLRANWLFQTVPLTAGALIRSAARKSLLTLSLLPVWIGSAAAFLWSQPWMTAAKHLVLLALFGVLLVEISLIGFHKIPFTCSYLPGKTKIHVTFVACIFLLPSTLMQVAEIEEGALDNRLHYIAVVAILIAAIVALRRYFRSDQQPQFEEFESNELVTLNLQR